MLPYQGSEKAELVAIRDFVKDPDADRSFPIDWNDALADADSISVSNWIVPAGLVFVSGAISGKRTSVRLSGGTDNTDYLVTNRITLASGEIDDRSIRIAVRTS